MNTNTTAVNLPAFRVTYDNGTSYTTSMAAGTTLETARSYFMGMKQTEENFENGEEISATVIKVESDCSVEGFQFGLHRIWFVEPKGKDISFPRWRMCLYYEAGMAVTEFFTSQESYNAFLAEAMKHTFAEYGDFRAWWDASGLESAWGK